MTGADEARGTEVYHLEVSASLLAHRIGDEWVAQLPGREDRDPHRTDEVVAHVSQATDEHLRAAAMAVRAALPAWSVTPALARGETPSRASALLAERAESIGRDVVREEGKTLAEGIGVTRRAVATLRYSAGQACGPVGELYASATPGMWLGTVAFRGAWPTSSSWTDPRWSASGWSREPRTRSASQDPSWSADNSRRAVAVHAKVQLAMGSRVSPYGMSHYNTMSRGLSTGQALRSRAWFERGGLGSLGRRSTSGCRSPLKKASRAVM